jgi:hypothetical protein
LVLDLSGYETKRKKTGKIDAVVSMKQKGRKLEK